jgi:hypothetical protein
MAEAMVLFKDNQPRIAIEAAEEAFDKLKTVKKEISKAEEMTVQLKETERHYKMAGFAYRQVLESAKNTFDLDVQRYNELNESLDEWNKDHIEDLADN